MMGNKYRIETDSFGEIKVEANKYWGAQTQRSLEKFKIGNKMPLEIIYAFAILKKSCAKANYRLEKLSYDKFVMIEKVCDEIISKQLDEHFPLVVWQTGSGTQTNMNVNEVIANRATSKILHPNDDVNKSQSSNDTFPTAMHIAAYSVLKEKFLPAIEGLKRAFEKKSVEFKNNIKIGRTHLMDATPISFGQEFSGYVSQLEKGIDAVCNSMENLLELAIGGTAVGTGLNAPKEFAFFVCEFLNEYLDYKFIPAKNKFEALSAHCAVVETHSALKQIAISLTKIANDIRLMASGPRCGLYELIIPSNEPGSSIMPGKVNPTQVEAITMVCAQVLGNDTAITVGAMNGQFELNVYKPLIIKNFLESVNLLSEACLSFSRNCIEGIKVNEEKIRFYNEQSLMLVTALNEKIGYDKAAQIAKKAFHENTSLKQAALALNFISEEDFVQIVDINKMI